MTALHVVILPGRDGLEVCDVDVLTEWLAENETLDAAIDAATIDSIHLSDNPETIRDHLARIRALNLTGDANAYWGIK